MSSATDPINVAIEIPEPLARLALTTHAGFSRLTLPELQKLEHKMTQRRVLRKATANTVTDLCAVVGFAFIMQLDAARKKHLNRSEDGQ